MVVCAVAVCPLESCRALLDNNYVCSCLKSLVIDDVYYVGTLWYFPVRKELLQIISCGVVIQNCVYFYVYTPYLNDIFMVHLEFYSLGFALHDCIRIRLVKRGTMLWDPSTTGIVMVLL